MGLVRLGERGGARFVYSLARSPTRNSACGWAICGDVDVVEMGTAAWNKDRNTPGRSPFRRRTLLRGFMIAASRFRAADFDRWGSL
jgi:hypothetical protein